MPAMTVGYRSACLDIYSSKSTTSEMILTVADLRDLPCALDLHGIHPAERYCYP